MSSLADLPEIVGFFSYSRDDDESYRGRLSALREGIQHELSAQLGRTKAAFRLWQDKEAIAPGKLWEAEIKAAVEQSIFFIPIVTPRAINSDYCRFEFEAFLARERELGRTDLVFPILYVPVPALQSEERWRNHPVLAPIARRQYVDWQTFRYSDPDTPAVREAIARFCNKVVEALHQSWLTPEERRNQEEAEAQQRAEAERRRQEAEAKRRADDEVRRQKEQAEEQRLREEAEAKRRREESESRARAEREAQAWTQLPQPLTIAALQGFLAAFPNGANAAEANKQLQSLLNVQLAFFAARRADSVAAIEKFRADYPGSEFEQAARERRDQLAKREEAHNAALASGEPDALRAFVETYPQSGAAQELRHKLLLVERDAAYRQAMATNDETLLRAFVDRYPKDADITKVMLHLNAIARDRAYNAAMISDDPAIVTAFLTKYARDDQAPQVRARLRQLQPSRLSRRTILVGGATAAGGVAIAVVALRRETPVPLEPQAPAAPAPAPPLARPAPVVQNPPAAPVPPNPFIRSFPANAAGTVTAEFSADSSLLMTHSSADKSSRLWDVNNGSLIALFAGKTEWNYARFSPDGSRIVTEAADDVPRLWEAKTGRQIVTLWDAWRPKPVGSLPLSSTRAWFCPDGSRLLTMADWENTAKLWDGRTGASVATLFAFHNGVSTTFSPDSSRIATSVMEDGNVRLWNARTGASIATVALANVPNTALFSYTSIEFSPDGGRLAISPTWDDVARLYDGKTGIAVASLSGHTANGISLEFSSDSERIVTTAGIGFSPKDLSVRLWDARTGGALMTIDPTVFSFGSSAASASAKFSPDGNLIATLCEGDKVVKVWDGRAVTPVMLYMLSGHTAPVGLPTFSPDSSRIVTFASPWTTGLDHTMRLWDAKTGKAVATISELIITWRDAPIRFGEFSGDSSRFVTSSAATARIWDSKTGQLWSTLSGHTGDITSANFSPNGRFVLTLSKDGTARLWDAAVSGH